MTTTPEPELTLQGGMAICRQIQTQIRDHIVTGVLLPGEQLPSVRALAVELSVNPTAVKDAYAALEGDGLLNSGEGSGTFVAALSVAGTQKGEFREEVERLCMSCLAQAARYGYSSEDVVNMIQAFAERGYST